MAEKSKSAESKELDFRTTAEIKVSPKIVEQVIGQEQAVRIIRKAAEQRRHVLLIGAPGTGKSMIGLALAELLPKEKLVDVLAFANPNDENQPLVRVVPAGKGRAMVADARVDSAGMFRYQNFIMFFLLIISMVSPWWAFNHYSAIGGFLLGGLMFAAFFLGGMVFLASFVLFVNLGRRIPEARVKVPKVIVDNFNKKQAPFLDATGAHAGALLGDVLHDPFQTFFPKQVVTVVGKGAVKNIEINQKIDMLFSKYDNMVLKKKEKNYEAVYLPKNELFVLGETNGSVYPVEVLSSNRYDYEGEMVKLTTSENKELLITPEHKIAVWKNDELEYVEAENIKEGDKIVSKAENIIIDEQDIINTYDKRQQDQCRLYERYKKIKAQHLTFGYQTIRWLKEKGLLPLKIDNPKLPLIAKVLGATFGDGGVFENLNGIFLSSSEKEAVEEFGRDLEQIFNLTAGENSRIIEGGEYGHSWCYQNTNRNIIRFFLALGAPKGNKTNTELIIPSWIKLNEVFEDEFYGSFLGGELGTPTLHKRGNYLTSLEVGITGLPDFKGNRIAFLNELTDYLKRKRVSITSIYEGKSKTEGSLIFRLLIEKKIDNVILFLINTKLNYCKYKRDRLYKALGQWALSKKNKYYQLAERGYGAEHAMKVLNLTPRSLYLLLNHFGPNMEVVA